MNPRRQRHAIFFAASFTLLVAALLVPAAPSAAAEPDWGQYQEILAAHVTSARADGVALNVVDYPGLRADPRFVRAIRTVQDFPTAQLATAAERLAFFINAYNLLAMKMVADHWPLGSIRDVGNLFRPVWKRPAGTLDGRSVSLDDIENEHLRKLGEPRIHLAIVCASVSCPDLRAEPYRAAALDAQLDDQVVRFFANQGKGLRVEGDTVHVSRIFDWFGEDFGGDAGVRRFITRYHPLPTGAGVAADLPYDWRVNATR